MMLVDVDRGKREGAAMAKELEGRKESVADPTGGIILIDEEADGQQHERR